MAIVIPILAFAAIWVLLLGEGGGEPRDWEGAGSAFLQAAVFWGAVVTLSSELLSLVKGLTFAGIVLTWLCVLAAALAVGWRRGSYRILITKLINGALPRSGFEMLCWIGVAVIALVALFVGWITPPNNVDALLYHVARIDHWAQDRGLAHYATAYAHQLLKPIWAETAMLHLRILWGSDQPVHLVQWFSMAGSLIGVVTLAGQLGAQRFGKAFAAVFAASIPMGILQASSAQNDYVVAFWAVCAAHFVLINRKRRLSNIERAGFGLVLGIGFLTKGTFYVYGPPLILWYFISCLRRSGLRRTLFEGIALAMIAMSLNLGFWVRNIITFGGPYGPSAFLNKNLGIKYLLPEPSSLVPSLESGGVSSGGTDGELQQPITLRTGDFQVSIPIRLAAPPAQPEGNPLTGFAVRILRTAAYNLITPSHAINQLALRAMKRLPTIFNKGYIQQWNQVAWNHEDTAPNPIHFALIPLTLVALLVQHRRQRGTQIGLYSAVVLSTYALIPAVVGHGDTIWGIRYQLPFFVLWAPVAGAALGSIKPIWFSQVLAAALLLSSLPWLLLNNTRPLIGMPPWPTRIGSILTTSPEDMLFASNPSTREAYIKATATISASSCKQVGLRIDSGDLEGQFWWLLNAPQSGIEIQSIFPLDSLKPLVDPNYHPCAILCTICGDRTRLNGLPLISNKKQLSLFMGDSFVPDPDG
jgi:hypothetical protein